MAVIQALPVPRVRNPMDRIRRINRMQQARGTRAELLQAINRDVISYSSLDAIVEQIVKTTKTTLRAEAASLLLPDETGSNLHFQVAQGSKAGMLQQVRVGLDTSIAGWVAAHSEPVIVNEVARDPRFSGEIDKVTGFQTRSVMCVPLNVSGELIGVLEVLNKLDGTGFSAQDLDSLTAVAATAALAIEGARLQQRLREGYKATLRSLAAAIDAKDHYTRGHSRRVMQYALMAGWSLGLDAKEMDSLEQGAVLHDVGKIGVDGRVLRKPRGLTAEERLEVEAHTVLGADIVSGVPFLKEAADIILHHHERWDGTGYPDHLAGKSISIGARIVAVADAFDTMTTDRPYRKAMSFEQAAEELLKCSGNQFCPKAVEALLNGLREYREAADGAAKELLGL